MTLGIEFSGTGTGSAAAATAAVAAPTRRPLYLVPAPARHRLTVSLVEGCESPLEALRTAGQDDIIRCHPYDEAVVRLLMGSTGSETALFVTTSVPPGTLSLG